MIHVEQPNDSPDRQQVVSSLSSPMNYRTECKVGPSLSSESLLALYQVEMNLMASSFCGLSHRMVEQHRVVMTLLNFPDSCLDQLPENNSANDFADCLAQACQLYKRINSSSSSISHPYVLMIAPDTESNVYDQCCMLMALVKRKVKVLRRSFSCLNYDLTGDDRRLFVDDCEIGVVYFRHGYVPDHFPDEETWRIKYDLERSQAIKCPSIAYMLANTKLVQTALANPGQLGKFISPQSPSFHRLLSVFAPQHFLSPAYEQSSQAEIDLVVRQALAHPDDYVLKPQREGGGNNYFGEQLVSKLNSLVGSEEARAYVLMKRFHPYLVDNCIINLGSSSGPVNCKLINELGVFGAFLCCDDTILVNRASGFLLRSKPASVNEGGIVAGSGCLDSPLLV